MSQGATRNKARIDAIIGATGSGKSSYIKRALSGRHRPRRLLVWDVMSEYGEFGQVVTKASEFRALVKAAGARGPLAVIYRPGLNPKTMADKFEVFCRTAFEAGNLCAIVEELKLVTKPAAAPLHWVQCCIQGRHRGLHIIGTSQRPAHIDKDFLGNATMIRAGCLGYLEDMRAVASAMMIRAEELAALAPLQFVAYDKHARSYQRGTFVHS